MLKIDNSLLQDIGLGNLPDDEKNSLLKHIYETLEMRVGMRLADQMSNEQLDEFEQYFEAKDDAGAFKWLETNFPNYKDIVQEEFDKLKAEVAQAAPQILSASEQPTMPNPAQQQAVDPAAQQQWAAPPADNQQYQPPQVPTQPQQPVPNPAFTPPQQPYAVPAQPVQDQSQATPIIEPQSQPLTPPQQPPFPNQQPPAGPGYQAPPQQ
jgi:hypothetical protein